jgi:hypothetical protein
MIPSRYWAILLAGHHQKNAPGRSSVQDQHDWEAGVWTRVQAVRSSCNQFNILLNVNSLNLGVGEEAIAPSEVQQDARATDFPAGNRPLRSVLRNSAVRLTTLTFVPVSQSF